MERQAALLGQHVGAERGRTLGAGEHDRDRVLLPGAAGLAIGRATPEVGDGLAAQLDAEAGADLATLPKIGLEGGGDRFEPRGHSPLHTSSVRQRLVDFGVRHRIPVTLAACARHLNWLRLAIFRGWRSRQMFQSTMHATARPDATARGEAGAFAALDLGTNNCRLLIGAPTSDGFRVLDSFSRIVRLGEGLQNSGVLSEMAMDRTLGALHACAARLARRPVRGVRAIATEACRRAGNGPDFLRRVRGGDGAGVQHHLDARGGGAGPGGLRAAAARPGAAGAAVRHRRGIDRSWPGCGWRMAAHRN